jgi:hypothetical protein
LFKVQSNVGEFFLNISDNFSFSSGGEGVTSFGQDLHQVISKISSGKIESEDSVREGISFVDWNSVGNTITRIHDNTGGSSRSIERQDGLNGDVHGRGVEGFEHNLSHLFSVGLWVQRSFSQQDRVFFRSNSELVVEGVVPDLFHIVPVGNNTVFNGVLQGQDTSLGLSFITNIGILLSHTNHDTSVSWSTNN